MKKSLLVLMLLAFCGVDNCNNPPPNTTYEAEPYQLSYITDHRTGLCFARYHSLYPSIALVPCDSLKKVMPATVESPK
jgi:hypothetical protein